MPEIDLLFTPGEERRLIEHVLAVGGWFVPDLDYDSPEPARIDTFDEYLQHRRMTRSFFALHPTYFAAPLEMKPVQKEGTLKYFISKRNGGPAIEFLSTVEFEEAGRQSVNAGFLAYHTTFWNQVTSRNEKLPRALLSLFRSLTGLVKRSASSRKIGSRRFWIGREMESFIARGDKVLGIRMSSDGAATTESG